MKLVLVQFTGYGTNPFSLRSMCFEFIISEAESTLVMDIAEIGCSSGVMLTSVSQRRIESQDTPRMEDFHIIKQFSTLKMFQSGMILRIFMQLFSIYHASTT